VRERERELELDFLYVLKRKEKNSIGGGSIFVCPYWNNIIFVCKSQDEQI